MSVEVENKVEITIRRKSMKSNFMWNLLANLFFGLSQWAMISAISKFGNIEMVGIYTLALGLCAPVFLLLNLNIRSVQATDQQNEYTFDEYYNFRLVSSIVALIILVFLTLAIGYDIEIIAIVYITAIMKLIDSQSDINYGFFQKIENMQYIAYSKVLKGVFNVVLLTIIIFFTENLIYSLATVLIMNIFLTYFIELKPINKINGFKWSINQLLNVIKNRSLIKSLLFMGIPLGVAGALDSLTINAQRFIIEPILGAEKLGYYASITYIMISGQTIIGALGHAVLPRLTIYFNQDLKRYVNLVIKLLIIGLGIGMFLFITSYYFGSFILTFLYNKSYVDYTELFVIIMFVAAVWYITGFFNIALLATRIFKYQWIIYLGSFLVTSITSIFLINSSGLIGAAYSLLYGMLFRFFIIKLIVIRIVLKNRRRF